MHERTAPSKNPLCAGSGCSAALTGDGQGDIYGAYQCSEMGSFNGDAGCVDAGMWKWSGGAASYEPFNPGTYSNACGNVLDTAMTFPEMLGTTAAAMNSDPCGPELLTESSGTFSILPGSQLVVHCSSPGGALWGASPSDYYE